MIPRFRDRLERFRPRDQFILGMVAIVPAWLISLLIPSPLLGALVMLFVLTPLSIVAVSLIASSIQKARNTVIAVETEARLASARDLASTSLGVATSPRDPDWAATLARIEIEESRVLAAGRKHGSIITNAIGDDIDGVTLSTNLKLSQAEAELFGAKLKNLRRIRAAHPTVANVTATREAEKSLYLLIGQAATGMDIAAMRAVVPLGREFAVVGDCENGHWAVHNMDKVYTAPGGQRLVIRACDCGSRWTETI